MKTTNLSFDKVAISVLLILLALVGITIFIGENRGVIARVNLTQENEAVSPYQKIQITFSESVNTEMAFDLITLNPVHEGYLEWADERTLYFVPLKPFALNTNYTLTISAGVITSNGDEIKKSKSWNFHVREPMIAYMLTDANQSGVWAIDLNGNEPKRLTSEDIKVLSFDAAGNGDFVVFTTLNENGGVDLWKVNRDGSKQSLLLDCEFDRCTVPSISPDAKYVAYSRESAGPTPDIPYGSPRVWLLNLQTGANNPVYADQQVLGYNPSWSPDSKKLISFDGLADLINLYDLSTNQQFVFPSNTGGPVVWSPDSTKFMFTIIRQTQQGFRSQVRLADLTLNETTTLIGENDDQDYGYYSLAWSSLEERAVMGFRLSESQPAQVLWMFNPARLDGILVADEPEYTYNAPQWDPWGSTLVFQQFRLKGVNAPEIGYWQDGFDAPKFLTNGILPKWLP
ncbi:MAG: Ig-like domain-containing protein [Anaerolineales bacterium]|nr:Ig-like domain-containing protein [Anaerolineales bacterium]MBX3036776.1 Ig-like domain-containing protein [Anaerolineales bacterium]